MGTIPELPQDVRDFVKVILTIKADPTSETVMSFFRGGAWYMSAMDALILTLPDDDPSLTEVLVSLKTGAAFNSDGVARNILRWNMARPEMEAFFKANVAAESMMLHARMLVQGCAALQRTTPIRGAIPQCVGIFKTAAKALLWYLPQILWFRMRSKFRCAIGRRQPL